MSLTPMSGRDLAQIRWGEALRRQKRRRRRWQWRIAMTEIAAIVLLASAALGPEPRLLWNASASAPVGLYEVDPKAVPRRGDMVAASLSPDVASLAAERGYLPLHVPVVKMVMAVPGDRICAIDGIVSVNGKRYARQLSTDRAGRPLAGWSGCRRLRNRQYLLLNAGVRDSFDGRYFGPTDALQIIGTVTPLWLD